MAKAQQVSERALATDPKSWLAEVLRTRFTEVLSYREAVLEGSAVEPVHDMRVAIRRLRSVIRDFAEIAEKLPLKEIRSDLKRLADALGAVRDADVAIRSLEKLAVKAKEDPIREGIAQIIEQLRAKRESGYENLGPHLSLEAVATLEQHFEKGLNKSIGQRNLFDANDLDQSMCEIISNRVDDFLEPSNAIYDPFSLRRLHRLRIAGKHLRYAVELFSLYTESNVEGFADTIAKMQSHLGDVHDCDVWIEQLHADLKARKSKELKGKKRDASLWLLSQFVRRRNKAYRSALKLWSEWEQTDVLERLKKWEPATTEPESEKMQLRLVK